MSCLPCVCLDQAMVDVDETYREPLLGEAFYHEKALTVTRVGGMTPSLTRGEEDNTVAAIVEL